MTATGHWCPGQSADERTITLVGATLTPKKLCCMHICQLHLAQSLGTCNVGWGLADTDALATYCHQDQVYSPTTRHASVEPAYFNGLCVDSRLLWNKVHAPLTLLLLHAHIHTGIT